MMTVLTRWLSPDKRRRTASITALISAVALVVILGTVWLAAPKAHAASPCQVTYSVTRQWTGGFTVQAISIQNTSGSAWSSWTLVFTFPNAGQTVGSGPWNGNFTQSGQNVTVTNVSYNGSVANNASVNPAPGFNGTWTTSNGVPANFIVNGNMCNNMVTPTATSVSGTATSAPTSTATPGNGATPTPTATPTGGLPLGYPYPNGVSNTGNATWFSGIGGSAYGGCGVPQADLDSQNFLALNVQNTPGNYSTMLPRPIPAADESQIGFFDNGLNCGRWVKVTIGNNCTGTNDGAPNQPFCRNGSWVSDQYNGATLDMVVADSCQDGNAWCRDDPYHVDLVNSSLNLFVKNGQPVGNMYPNAWNNRQVSWQFEPAPNYVGDITLGILQGANPYWTAISITHLANGIHGVDYFQNGAWVKASTDSDMGDDYVVLPTTPAGSSYQIRVYDATNQLINNGRIYSFTYPASCGTSCPAEYMQIPYTTS
jgi:hypothetical protein